MLHWHFVFMCCSSTFLSHSNNMSFFLLFVFFGEFQQESYESMWRHYGYKVMGIYLGPLSGLSCLTINIF
jgi:hypothetical protein